MLQGLLGIVAAVFVWFMAQSVANPNHKYFAFFIVVPYPLAYIYRGPWARKNNRMHAATCIMITALVAVVITEIVTGYQLAHGGSLDKISQVVGKIGIYGAGGLLVVDRITQIIKKKMKA